MVTIKEKKEVLNIEISHLSRFLLEWNEILKHMENKYKFGFYTKSEILENIERVSLKIDRLNFTYSQLNEKQSTLKF